MIIHSLSIVLAVLLIVVFAGMAITPLLAEEL